MKTYNFSEFQPEKTISSHKKQNVMAFGGEFVNERVQNWEN